MMGAAGAAASPVPKRVLRIDRGAAPGGQSAADDGHDDGERDRERDHAVVNREAEELGKTRRRERPDGAHSDVGQGQARERDRWRSSRDSRSARAA